MDVIETLRKLCDEAGLQLVQCGQGGHFQLRGGPLLVNYYPLSKKRSAYVAGTTCKRTKISPAEAVRMTRLQPPLIADKTKKDKRSKGSRKVKIALWERGVQTCYWCLCPMQIEDPVADDYFTLEHKIPLARGGLNHPNNVTLACRRCNLERGHNMPELLPRRP